MDRFVLKQDEIEFLGSVVRVSSYVDFMPVAELERKLDEDWETIIAQIPTAKRPNPAKRPSLRGTTFSIQHPITDEEQVFEHDMLMDALPDVNFDDFALEYASEIK